MVARLHRIARTDLAALGACAASGLLLTASFPKIEADLLAWAALVPLIGALNGTRPGEALRRGLVFGIVHFASLLYWLVPTMVIYGHLPWPLAIGILFLFACVLSLLAAAPVAAAVGLAAGTPGRLLLLFPVFWVGAEYLRSFLFTGFPWELLGYSQYRRLHLIQVSDIFGVYGLSGLIALTNAALFLAALRARGGVWYGRPVSLPLAIAGLAAAGLGLALTVGYALWRIPAVDREAQSAPTVRVAAIQGNIEQSQKWDPAFQRATIERYLRRSREALAQAPELIVWPESAAPFYFPVEAAPTRMVREGIAAIGVHFLIGAPAVELVDGRPVYFNSAFLVAPSGEPLGRYDKAHLVPYGEYTPYKEYLPFLGKMVEHVGDFAAGERGRTLAGGGWRLGVQICYEIIFPPLAAAQVKNGANLIVTITNDAWYGTTAGPYQHFSLAVLRAVENRRAVVRAANTGISGFIDPAGRILEATPLMTEAAVVRPLPLMEGLTAYHRIGDAAAAACLGASLLAAIVAAAGRRRPARRPPAHTP